MSTAYARMQLPFPPESYAAHLVRVQDSLRAEGLLAVLIFDPENIFWLTGYRSIGYFTFQCLLVPADGRPVMVSRQVNHAISSGNANIADFIPVGDTQNPVEVLSSFLRSALPEGRIGVEVETTYLSVDVWRQLDTALPGRLADWGGVIEEERRRKTPLQLDYMRQAADAAVAGLDEAIRTIAPGRTENDLAAAMLKGTTAAGSEYTRVPLVSVGDASGVCFTTWERRAMKRGDLVFLEAAANINRYHAMIARNCTVGPASMEQKRFSAIVIEALDRTIDAIRPGVTSHDVDAACRKVFEDAGVGAFFDHRTAYGIGIGFPPNWAEGRFLALKPGDSTVLEMGMTFHLVPRRAL